MELQRWSAAWPWLGKTHNKPLSAMTQICLPFLPTERHLLLAAALLYTPAGGECGKGSENSRGGCWDGEGAAILFVKPVFFVLFCLVDEVWG